MQSSCNPACSPHMVPPFLPQCGPSWLWVAALLCRRENRQRSQRCQPHPNLPTGKLGHWDWIFTRPVFDCHWKNKTRTLPLSYIQTHLLWYLKLEEPPKFCNSWWCHTKPPVFTGNFQTLPYRAHWSWWHFFPSMHLAQRPSQSVAHVPIVHYWGSMEAAKSPQPDSAAPGFCWSKFVKFSSLPGSPLLKKNKKNCQICQFEEVFLNWRLCDLYQMLFFSKTHRNRVRLRRGESITKGSSSLPNEGHSSCIVGAIRWRGEREAASWRVNRRTRKETCSAHKPLWYFLVLTSWGSVVTSSSSRKKF